MFKFVKQLLVACLVSILITSVIPVAKAYAFTCEETGAICAVIVSEPQPQDGQSWRSSDNFSTSNCLGTKMQWHITTGEKEAIFDVALDESGSDPKVYLNLTDCAVTGLIQAPKMYIGNPRSATENFQLVIYTNAQ